MKIPNANSFLTVSPSPKRQGRISWKTRTLSKCCLNPRLPGRRQFLLIRYIRTPLPLFPPSKARYGGRSRTEQVISTRTALRRRSRSRKDRSSRNRFFNPRPLKGPATQKGIYFPSSESFEALSFGSCALAKSKKLCCGICSPGGVSPRCRYAARVTQRPRGVRFKKPICIKYGS